MKFVYSEHDQKEIEKIKMVAAKYKNNVFNVMRKRGIEEKDLEHEFFVSWNSPAERMLSEFMKTRIPVGVEIEKGDL